jgi:hypothetical protein
VKLGAGLARGRFGFDCNSQTFGILKGFNLVAVGELATPTDHGANVLVDPGRVKPSVQM